MKYVYALFLLFSFNIAEAKIVLITGASRGLGLATAEHLAQKGYRVYAGVRDKSLIADQQNLIFVELDVTDPATIQAAVSKIVAAEGRIDVLINNAAYAIAGPLEMLTMDEMLKQMDVNFWGPIRMSQEVIPQMRKQSSGRIINISSEQGIYGLPFGCLYTSSKAALESMSEALSIELLPWNIHVSIVEPGLIRTKFSIAMGTRPVEGNPYAKIVTDIKKSLQERFEHPDILSPSQSAEEVAEFLCQVIEEETPKLRYQTSEACQEMVSMKLKDLSGEAFTTKMGKAFSQ